MNRPQKSQGSGQPIELRAGNVLLHGDLYVPDGARGIVLFAHGSGSSRHSSRNRFVAGLLREGLLGTLLTDLLTAQEEAADAATGHLRFDIDLLGERLVALIDWLHSQAETRSLPIGLFGASTGAAAALVAASLRPRVARTIVSRGGRPDLARAALPRVTAPTLLIVGERDTAVIELNREAFQHLGGEKALIIVPRATHLFEEPGALEEVGRLAREWFARHLEV
jgi:putative phosphoribosyl transferase